MPDQIPAESHDEHPPAKRPKAKQPRSPGAWLPWETVEQLCRLRMGPSSVWQVFLAVQTTSARYGGGIAWLGIADLMDMTGLCERAVKKALSYLISNGLRAP